MDILTNISEYFEELFPVTEAQKKFYSEISDTFNKPVKYLRICSGTGAFEHSLSKDGSDVTGIETVPELLDSSNRKRRTQLMSLRFFQMSTLEMARFLGKGFYNIISILDDRIIFISDETLLKKFFYDAKQLLSENGKFIIKLPNFLKFDETNKILPVRESIRVKLSSKIESRDGKYFLKQTIETGNGKILPVTEDAQINLLKKDTIEKFSKAVGFSSVEFYSDFEKHPFNEDCDDLIAVLS